MIAIYRNTGPDMRNANQNKTADLQEDTDDD